MTRSIRPHAVGPTSAGAVAEACAAVGLGALSGPPVPMTGGYLHRVLRVSLAAGGSAGGSAVVKLIDPVVIPATGWDRLRDAEAVARNAAAAGVPAVAAYAPAGDPLVELADGTGALVFPHVTGRILPLDALPDVALAAAAGTMLGRLHAAGLDPGPFLRRGEEPLWEPVEPSAWRPLVTPAGSPVLTGLLPLLEDWSARYAHGRGALGRVVVAGHGDLSPRNVLWSGVGSAGPVGTAGTARPTGHVIDWEHAGPVDPAVEAATGAVEWSRDPAGRVDPASFRAFVRAYRSTPAGHFLDPAGLLGCAGRLMAWLAYNLGRAAGESPEPDGVHLTRAVQAAGWLRGLDTQWRQLEQWLEGG